MRNHPLTRAIVDGVALAEGRAPRLSLTAEHLDLLARSARSRHPLAFVTGDGTRLTEPLRAAIVAAGAAWIVQTPTGMRDGLTARPLPDFATAFTSTPPALPHPGALFLERPEALQLIASVAVRHHPRSATLLGGALDTLSRAVDLTPTTWGPSEPAIHAWERAQVTRAARRRMPRETRVVVLGAAAERALAAAVTVRRTARGVEEITEMVAVLGAIDDSAADARADAAVDALDGLTQTAWPLAASLSTRPGRSDLTTSAFLAPAARPLAVLIGAPAVRDLRLDPSTWAARHGARVAGRPRTPALVLPVRRSAEPAAVGWERLRRITADLGPVLPPRADKSAEPETPRQRAARSPAHG